MQYTTTGGHHDSHHVMGEAVWIVAGIIVIFAFGDILTLLALTVAAVAMTVAWLTFRSVEHRVERSDAKLASVTNLRPALTGPRNTAKASAPTSWRGPSAA